MSLRQLFNIYRLETQYEWLKTIRNPAFSLPAVLFPTLFYIFFGVLLNQGNTAASSYLLCTYGVFGIMGPALFSFGAGLAIERGQGWLDLKEVSPMPGSAQIVSRVLVSMGFSTMILLSLGLVASLFTSVSLSISQSLLLVTVLVIGGLPFCLLGLTLGLLLKSDSAPTVVNLIYLPMSFFSGLWIPISVLPVFLQKFAQFLPPFHLAQLALKVTKQDGGTSAWVHIGVLGVFTLIFFITSLLAFRRKQG
jgi:ABC-2 type transport system permease protein